MMTCKKTEPERVRIKALIIPENQLKTNEMQCIQRIPERLLPGDC